MLLYFAIRLTPNKHSKIPSIGLMRYKRNARKISLFSYQVTRQISKIRGRYRGSKQLNSRKTMDSRILVRHQR